MVTFGNLSRVVGKVFTTFGGFLAGRLAHFAFPHQ